MHLQTSDLLGVALGFAIGGVLLAGYLWMAPEPPVTTAEASPEPVHTVVQVRPAAPVRPDPRLQPARPAADHSFPAPPGPNAATGVTSGGVALPNVIRPTEPELPRSLSGTGFFIGQDGSVLTAAHVVDGCRATRVTSQFVRPADARLVAASATDDLALLQTAVRPPKLLALTDQPAGGRTLTVYGYPAGGHALIPAEALARARPNPRAAMGWPEGPGMWLDAIEVRRGFSGGPVITPDGEVIGLVMGMMLRPASGPGVERVQSGIAVGPDTRAINAFLRRAAPELDATASWTDLAADTEAAREAVVHVHCWR
jgi:S1-C subfamily serine protease